MTYLSSNIPQFKCWVRKEFTNNHMDYEGEYLHALVIAVNTIPDRSLTFNVVFTGCDEEENVHGGARMPITALIADTRLEEWPVKMPTHLAQPWDCSSRNHAIIVMDRVSSSPWLCKIDNVFHTGRYLFFTFIFRVRVTNPALWVTGEGAPSFAPSQYVHSAEIHDSYMNPYLTFNNLYQKGNKDNDEEK